MSGLSDVCTMIVAAGDVPLNVHCVPPVAPAAATPSDTSIPNACLTIAAVTSVQASLPSAAAGVALVVGVPAVVDEVAGSCGAGLELDEHPAVRAVSVSTTSVDAAAR